MNTVDQLIEQSANSEEGIPVLFNGQRIGTAEVNADGSICTMLYSDVATSLFNLGQINTSIRRINLDFDLAPVESEVNLERFQEALHEHTMRFNPGYEY